MSLQTRDSTTTATPGWDLPPGEWLAHLQGMTPPSETGAGLPLSELALPPTEALVVLDIPTLKLVHLTPAAERFYGHPLAELCRHPQLMFAAIHPSDAEPVADYVRRLLEQPEGRRLLRLQRPDGSSIWVRSHYKITRDAAGRPLRLFYRLRQVDDRELQRLRGQVLEPDTEQLADIVPGFVFELDDQGRVVYANRYAALLTGYRPRHVREGLSMAALFLPEDLPDIREYFANLMAGREMPPREFRILGRDGSLSVLFGSAVRVVRNGKPAGIRGVLVDVTDRKQAERRFRLLEAALHRSHDSVFLLDAAGRIVWVNETALGRLGYTREELIGREACDIETTLPPGGCRRIIESLRGDTRTRVMQGRHRTRDGRLLPVEVVVNLISFEGQDYVSVIARDITARLERQAEQDALLKRLQRQRNAYQELTGDLALENGSWPEAIARTCRVVAAALEVDRVGFWTPDEAGRRLVCESLHGAGETGGRREPVITLSDPSPYLQALGREHVLAVSDVSRDSRFAEMAPGYLREHGVRARLDTALLEEGTVQGVLCCEHRGEQRRWQPDEISFAVSVASLLMRVRERCARQTVERERALFRTAADQASYGTLVQRLDGTIVYVNRARAAMHGYTPAELVGRNIRDLFPEESRGLVDDLVAEVRRQGAFSGRETWQRRRDGSRVCLLVNAVLVRGDSAASDVIVSTTVDITELKENQQALQEERRRLRNYISSLPGFVFRIRHAPDWPVEFISEGCRAITGWGPEDLTENRRARHEDCVHPDDKPLVWEAMHAAMESGEPYEVEYRVVHRNGDVRWVWERGYGVYGKGGELVAAEGFVFDITDRVTAERAIRRLNTELEKRVVERTRELQESREKYRLLVESLRDSFVFLTFSPQGEVLYASPSLETMLGYSLEQFRDLHKDMLRPREDHAAVQAAFHQAALGEHPSPVVMDIQHADGDRRTIEVVFVPVVKEGNVLSIEAVGHDITEHKRNLETIQQAQEQLVEAEKMAALGRMVAGMAHEINTPIGIGVTAATHLQQLQVGLAQRFRAGKLTRGDLERYLSDGDEASRMILANLNKAAQLIQGFKGVAVDQSNETRRRFDLKEYLEEILLSLRPALKKTPHTVALDCPAGLEVDSRPGALSHVITNLVMNSLIHGFADREEPGRITIAVAARDGAVTLRYSDDGAGMSEQVRQHIYEPFFTTRRGEGGSGLGMHVVYRAVTESLAGTIVCTSKPGRGVVFTITFPQRVEDGDD